MFLKALSIFFFTLSLLKAEIFFYSNNQKVVLTPLDTNASQSVRAIAHAKKPTLNYFYVHGKNLVGVGDELLVKTKDINKIVQKYEVEVLQKFSDSIYLLRVKDKAFTIETANKLYEEGEAELSHPNFHREIFKR